MKKLICTILTLTLITASGCSTMRHLDPGYPQSRTVDRYESPPMGPTYWILMGLAAFAAYGLVSDSIEREGRHKGD